MMPAAMHPKPIVNQRATPTPCASPTFLLILLSSSPCFFSSAFSSACAFLGSVRLRGET